MPEIEFTIDTETGKCETEIKGVRGASCEKAARKLKKLLGSPEIDRKTREYFAEVQNKRQVKR
jgi:hypothetical protein